MWNANCTWGNLEPDKFALLFASLLYKPVNKKITIISSELNPSAKIKIFKIMYNSMFSLLLPWRFIHRLKVLGQVDTVRASDSPSFWFNSLVTEYATDPLVQSCSLGSASLARNCSCLFFIFFTSLAKPSNTELNIMENPQRRNAAV